jgi:hypothetical protein
MEPASTIHLSAWLVALLGGTAVPVLTGLITKLQASAGMKAVVALLLSAVVTVIAVIVQADGTFVAEDVLKLFATTFVAHATTYYGFWRPIGGGAAPGAVATADAGIG